jgi:hypothetical protein
MARNHNFGLGAIKFLSVSSVLSVVKREVQPFTTDGTEVTEKSRGECCTGVDLARGPEYGRRADTGRRGDAVSKRNP